MVYARSRKLAVPILEEWDFYSNNKKREHFHAHDTILGQPIELFMFPHVPSKPKDGEEKEANEKALKMYLDSIVHAKRKIVVSMVVWTMKDIAKALVKARLERRVDVSCYGANIDPMVRQILVLSGIPLYNRPVTHHKTMLIDDAVLVNEAANFSISAFSRSDESATKMEECNPQQVAAVYQAIQALPI
jgi:phosphatidylserine/phosphatidylglycerophosphate/cardiolipin synthase-like enzyme